MRKIAEIDIGNEYTDISYVNANISFYFYIFSELVILFSIPSESICQMSRIKKLLEDVDK